MPAPAWEDLDAFFSVDDFATVASIQLQAGGTRQVRGIFDEPYLNAQLGEYEMDASAPRFTCKESDLAGVRHRDTITVGGKLYDIHAVQPDGLGMAMLQLEPAL